MPLLLGLYVFSEFHGFFACLRKKHIGKASIVFSNVERLLRKGPGTVGGWSTWGQVPGNGALCAKSKVIIKACQ